VHLDDRPVRTPKKAPLILPTQRLAEAVAAEWLVQGERVDPTSMPFTRTANSAVDTVAVHYDSVARMVADYGASDLLCYRAEGPAELVDMQARGWDPMLDWAADVFGARLRTATGIIHVAQSPESLVVLERLVREQTPFQLAAFHDLVSISGSLILALAVVHGSTTADDAWRLSRIDEDWQISQWGEDEEAADVAQRKRAAFLLADRFYGLCG
jgi:chaperone required for assembly of F1-ATPase